MRLFYDANIKKSDSTFTLTEEESKHVVRVLRMKEGDRIALLNGKGDSFTCEIIDAHPKRCDLKIREHSHKEKPKYDIHIAISPTKQLDRMEWFVEKATEIGATEITLISCKNQERSKVKVDRLLKKAISAMKQSHRAYLPIINELDGFNNFVKNHSKGLIAHCYENPKEKFEASFRKTNCPILIGPEGDFTQEEIAFALQNGYKTITLGENRLRTETAGVYVCVRSKLLLE
ncbi:MAG: 16S rRNA (uracil(1498)-N(3))-methyltransferase [Fluviicola sp.]|nr:16S rRNA (uracil(1498)-N(3))-methyltransferase [Fluviicola sp.]